MKKLLCFLLAALIPVAFAGCAQNNAGNTDVSDDAPTEDGGNMSDEVSDDENNGSENADGAEDNQDAEDTDGYGDNYADDNQDADDSAAYAYTVTPFFAMRGGYNIYCKLYVPQKEGKSPAVILSHSANLTAEAMNSYAAGFAERGFVACSFDFCGGSSDSRSDGATEDMTIFTEKEDLKAVLAAVKGLETVDGDNILLLGSSQGGLVSALVANDCPDDISALILLYPAFNIPEIAQSSSSSSASGSEKFIESLLDFDPYENIGNFKGKVLILHGSNDFIVNESYSERAAEIYENCELHIINGATHGFNGDNLSFGGFDLSVFFGNYDKLVWFYVDAFLQ